MENTLFMNEYKNIENNYKRIQINGEVQAGYVPVPLPPDAPNQLQYLSSYRGEFSGVPISAPQFKPQKAYTLKNLKPFEDMRRIKQSTAENHSKIMNRFQTLSKLVQNKLNDG